ncbi:MAG: aminotransferase class I/II-fold pyridoxal phosphate-dependent enzyme [Actinomycetes bacterium]
MTTGFSPPPYPYERLSSIRLISDTHDGGTIDCSIGTPWDPPPQLVIDALGSSGLERGYPTSAGSGALLGAARRWMNRRFGVDAPETAIAACVGTKEFVASTAHYLALRTPDRDVVLYPSISYPTYAMGAALAGLTAVPVSVENGRLRLEDLDPSIISRALLVWSNSPSNPTGDLDDLEAVAAWGRAHGVVVASDECYAEFAWDSGPASILQYGLEGVVAVHSLSKRSNLAGLRAGFYAGDPELVAYLRSVRQHAGMMVPGPVQHAAAAALDDDAHVELQRERYRLRLDLLADALRSGGYDATLPRGTFYLWLPVPGRLADGWALAAEIAERTGMLVSPGDLYGPEGADFVRIAVVQPESSLELVAKRLSAG